MIINLMNDDEPLLDEAEDEILLDEEPSEDETTEEESIEEEPAPPSAWAIQLHRMAARINKIFDNIIKQRLRKEVRETLCRIKEQYPYLEVNLFAPYIPYTFKIDQDYRNRRMMECAALYPQYVNIDVNHYSDYKDYVAKYDAAKAAMAEACRTEVKYRDLKIA